MASKALAKIALLLSLNLPFLSMANAHNQPKCQKDSLILNACANVLENFVNVRVGNPHSKCCSLIRGLVDLELDALPLHCRQCQCFGSPQGARSHSIEPTAQFL
ncbi:hypothetical protein DITRI_Ditri07aG0152000 [Diplodiscus trichospermus]